VNWRLHPDAAVEHEERVAYYEERRVGLGARYHSGTILAITSACQTPLRFRIVRPPNIRKAYADFLILSFIARWISSCRCWPWRTIGANRVTGRGGPNLR
jgi:hypothetical protein